MTPQNQDSLIKYTDVLMQLAWQNDEYYKVISNWIALKYEPGKTKLMDGEAVYSNIILKYFTPEKLHGSMRSQYQLCEKGRRNDSEFIE